MNCNDAVEALVASVESGTPMNDEQREHLRTCARCRELLDSAKHFQSMLAGEPSREPAVDAAAVETAVRHEHRKSVAWRVAILVLAIAILPFLAGKVASGMHWEHGRPELVLVALLAFGPLVALYAIARSLARRRGKELYRRLHPKRWWLGVCVGLADATGIDVAWFRFGFVAAFIAGGGPLFYIALALAMPVHPADREYLWRFQAKRLVARIRSW